MTLKKKKYEIARLRLLLLVTTLKWIFAKSKKDRAKAWRDCSSLDLQIQMVISQPIPKFKKGGVIVGEKEREIIVDKNGNYFSVPRQNINWKHEKNDKKAKNTSA